MSSTATNATLGDGLGDFCVFEVLSPQPLRKLGNMQRVNSSLIFFQMVNL